MAKAYTALEGSQEDINRRLLRRIIKLERKVESLESESSNDG